MSADDYKPKAREWLAGHWLTCPGKSTCLTGERAVCDCDIRVTALAALLAEVAGEWHSIESVPRDGSRFLVAYPRAPMAKRTWSASDAWFIRIGKWKGGRIVLDMPGNHLWPGQGGLYWRPLPSVPSPEQVEADVIQPEA